MERLRAALSKLVWPTPPASPTVDVVFSWEARPATHVDPPDFDEQEFNNLSPSEALDLIAAWTETDRLSEVFFTVHHEDRMYEDAAGLEKLEALIGQTPA